MSFLFQFELTLTYLSCQKKTCTKRSYQSKDNEGLIKIARVDCRAKKYPKQNDGKACGKYDFSALFVSISSRTQLFLCLLLFLFLLYSTSLV